MNARSKRINQRRAPRKRAEFTTEVVDVIARRPFGYLGDVSATGLMVISAHAPRDMAIYQLRLSLAESDHPPRSIEVGVQALWHRPAGNPHQVWAGYRILAISDADAVALDDWLG